MQARSEAYIVSSVRTPVGKANRGSLRDFRPEEMGARVVRAALDRVVGLTPEMVDDVIIGCAYPEGPQGMNMGRIVALKAGLPDEVPGATVNRFCSSGLQTIVMASQSVAAGHARVVVAGGSESMSMVPMSGFYFSPDPAQVEARTESYTSMGNTAENVAEQYRVSRDDQDAWSLRSHQRALDAIASGRFSDEIVPLEVNRVDVVDGRRVESQSVLENDEGPRADSTLEALARLRPVFRQGGTVTAGNSSQMSDGAAASVVMASELCESLGLNPLARIVGFAVAGVSPSIMGVGPIPAVRKVLKQTGLKVADIGLVELNEAFASQALAVIRELELDPDIVNVNGGAIALGHPLGCTGAKLTATLVYEMRRRNVRYGVCTMCIGGGMGAAAVIENLTN
jgi:acetyl-CoA acyltransferase